MISKLLAKIRKDKNITKSEICNKTGINIGHMTHIEKGERNPSFKTLKNICKALGTPHQPIMYAYDIHLTEQQEQYKIVNHIAYDKIPAFDSASFLIPCPSNMPNASVAIKVADTSMEPILPYNSYAFIAFNLPLNHRDIGLFFYNNQIFIRRFLIRKHNLVLRAENNTAPDIILSADDNFYIIGKVLGSTQI